MSLAPATQWEIRTTGNAFNGGGFNNRIPGTSVDYSQQNASQLSKADLACAGGVPTVTSVSGGFTNAMVGNVMRIRSGTNFTAGFYEIVSFNSANSVVLDRNPATVAASNGVAEVGGAQINLDLIDTIVIGGNTVWIKAGTYAAHPAITLNTTTSTRTNPIKIYGYNTARGDNPTGTNRPLIQMGVNVAQFGHINTTYTIMLRNLSFEGTSATQVVEGHTGSITNTLILYNVKIANTNAAGGARCFYCARTEMALSFIHCEFSGTFGVDTRGIYTLLQMLLVVNCYFHDLAIGIELATANTVYLYLYFNIFAKLSADAITSSNVFNVIGFNNTFSNMPRAINANSGHTLFSNTFTDCSVYALPSSSIFGSNNNFFSNALNVAAGQLELRDNNSFVNPQFITPGSNYAYQRTSGLIGSGFTMRLGV